MIVFKDIERETQMEFDKSKDGLFYIEMYKIDEPSYSYFIELEDNEVQHLINVLTNHLKK